MTSFTDPPLGGTEDLAPTIDRDKRSGVLA
jgi:hypothetical protein